MCIIQSKLPAKFPAPISLTDYGNLRSCLFLDAQPNRLNVYDYVADEVNPAAQALKAEASTDDDPATKREER